MVFFRSKQSKKINKADSRRNKRIRNRRMMLVISVFTLGFLIIVARLIYLQVFDATDQYARQVDQLVDEVDIQASRGNIYDRNMNILAQNSTAKAVHIVPRDVKNKEKLIDELSTKLLVSREIFIYKRPNKLTVPYNFYIIYIINVINLIIFLVFWC